MNLSDELQAQVDWINYKLMNSTNQAAGTPELPIKLQISVRLKHIYGNQAIYPACDTAKTFAKMLGQSTLTKFDIEYIKQLGYTVAVEPEQLREL